MAKKPLAVQRAEEESARLQKELIEGKPSEGETPNTEGQPQLEVVTAPPGLPPLGVTEQPQQEKQEPAATPAAATEVDTLKSEITRLRSANSVLEGKYNAEVPRVQELNRQLTEKVQALEKKVEEAATATPATVEIDKEAQAAIDGVRSIYGDALADQFVAIAKGFASKQTVAPKVDLSGYDSKLQDLGSKVETFEQQRKREADDRYFSWLDTNIPNWKGINTDQQFLTWLNGKAPYSNGKTYHDVLTEAHTAQHGEVVKEVFDAFTSQFKTPTQTPAGSQIVPDTHGMGSVPAQQQAAGRQWKESEIASVYNARNRGELTDEQFAAYESEIQLATSQGRIVIGQ